MAKLYPPYIESKLPAQTGTVLRIPFRFNRATSEADIYHIMARVKTTSTDKWLGEIPTNDQLQNDLNHSNKGYYHDAINQNYVAEFNVNKVLKLSVGQYYKIQLAFYNTVSGVGYYSDVGIFKYTATPRVYIADLDNLQQNANRYEYIGVYSQEGKDQTEKVYQYRFDLKDSFTGEIIDTTGDLTHNSELDQYSYESRDSFILGYELAEGRKYTIQYTVKTLNNLTVQSPAYEIHSIDYADAGLKGNLVAKLDYDNGVIRLSLENSPDSNSKSSPRGFIISRASSEDNYSTWYDVGKFNVASYAPMPAILGTDYTIEQGVTYLYGLQQYQTSGLRTKRMTIASPITADFEDSFLYDGSRQFRIRFNPKISSFKTTILEAKQDTIGGKYPFFFRNGNVKYHEFPISGLVSYLGDPDGLFMSDAELGFFEYSNKRDFTPSGYNTLNLHLRSNTLERDNIIAERKFKMQALEWLNNGKPKLFRSPGEGNYIVRLMSISLSPEDQLSRMLHSFSAQACEIDDYNFANLSKYGFLPEIEYDNSIMRYATWPLKGLDNRELDFTTMGGVYKAEFREVPYGTKIDLNFVDGRGDQEIMIGNTGTYEVNIYDYPLMRATFKSTETAYGLSGYLDYGIYSADKVEDFGEVRNIIFSDVTYQHYGASANIMTELTNIKNHPGYIYFLRLETRTTRTIFEKNGVYYADSAYTDRITSFNKSVIYKVITSGGGQYCFDGANPSHTPMTPSYTYSLGMNKSALREFDLEGPGSIILNGIQSIETLRVDNGIVVDMVYQQQEYVYGKEEDKSEVRAAKAAWISIKDNMIAVRADETKTANQVKQAEADERAAYSSFISTLTRNLNSV